MSSSFYYWDFLLICKIDHQRTFYDLYLEMYLSRTFCLKAPPPSLQRPPPPPPQKPPPPTVPPPPKPPPPTGPPPPTAPPPQSIAQVADGTISLNWRACVCVYVCDGGREGGSSTASRDDSAFVCCVCMCVTRTVCGVCV